MSRSASPKVLQPEFTAVIKKSGRWWTGWIEEVPGVNCQERTRTELLESLHIALEELSTMVPRTAAR